jgi:hypothetical protein
MEDIEILKQANLLIASKDISHEYAYLFGVNVNDNVVNVTEIAHYWEIYALLGDPENKTKVSQYQYCLIVTYGWAIKFDPNEEEDYSDETITRIPPSEHPDRVRVSLRAMYSPVFGFTTSVYLEGTSEPMYDNAGKGMLADAIIALYNSNDSTSTSKAIEIGSIDIDDEDADLF